MQIEKNETDALLDLPSNESNQVQVYSINTGIPEDTNYLTIKKALWKIFKHAAPFSISRLVEVGGTFYIASLVAKLGENTLAASGLIFPVQTVVTNMTIVSLYSIGGKIGENFQQHPAMSDKYFKSGILNSIIISSSVGLLNGLATPSLLKLCKQPKEAIDIFSQFNPGFSVSLLPVLLFNVEQQFALGTQRQILVPIVTTLNVAATSISSYFLVSKYGVKGLGWASAMCNTVSTIGFGLYLAKTSPKNRLFSNFKSGINKKIIWELFAIGLPFALEAGVELISKEILNLFGGSLGKDYLGGISIANQSLAFVITPLFTIGASALYVAKNEIGDSSEREKYSRVRKIVLASSVIGLIYASLGAVTLLSGGQFGFLINPFLNEHNQDNQVVIDTAKNLLLIFGLSQIPNALRYVFGGGLYALDKTKTTMLVGFVTLGVLGLPLSYLLAFPAGLGVDAIFSVTGGMLTLGAGALFWKLKRSTSNRLTHNTDQETNLLENSKHCGFFKSSCCKKSNRKTYKNEFKDQRSERRKRKYCPIRCVIL